MVREQKSTVSLLSRFYKRSKEKAPGSTKIMFRPNVLEWLLRKHDDDHENGKIGGR